MTQKEFLSTLKSELEKNGVGFISDIMNDYTEHFTFGLQNGKTEEQIAEKLGNPVTIAKAYKTEAMISKVRNPELDFQWSTALQVVFRMLVIAPFNLIILLIPGAIVFSMIVAGWSVTAGLAGASIGAFAVFFKILFSAVTGWAAVAAGAGAFAGLGFALLSGIIMFAISKFILLALINYLQWNLKFVLEK